MGKKVSTNTFFDGMTEIIQDVICPDEDKFEAITPETKISELVFSDYELCALLEEVEARYETEIEEIETITTVSDLCLRVQKK